MKRASLFVLSAMLVLGGLAMAGGDLGLNMLLEMHGSAMPGEAIAFVQDSFEPLTQTVWPSHCETA